MNWDVATPHTTATRWLPRLTATAPAPRQRGWRTPPGLTGIWASTLLATVLALPAVAQETGSKPTPPHVSALDGPLFYQLLVSEMQQRSDQPGPAYALMLDAARKTRDPVLFRRAIEMALQARAGESALGAARAWSTALPQESEPWRYTLQILLALNRPADADPVLRRLLQQTPIQQRPDLISALPGMIGRKANPAATLQAIEKALQSATQQPYTAPAAKTTIGRLQWTNQQPVLALASARQALAIDPGHLNAALLALELLPHLPHEAGELVQRYLQHTGAQAHTGLWQGYIRTLMEQQQFTHAQTQLQQLLQAQPNLASAWLLQGQLHWQTQQRAAAQQALQRYLQLSSEPADHNPVYLLLSQIAEEHNDLSSASTWLEHVDNSKLEDPVPVVLRHATLLARQGKAQQGRALLDALPDTPASAERRKWLAQAQWLRDQAQYNAALAVFEQASTRFPDDMDLRYEHAMTAEKAGQLAKMEHLLRAIIAEQPDYHHAYNALGYTLADRNERLPEAKALIQQALALSPNDGYILDSLGWVEFRLGNLPEALRLLQQAYTQHPDAEIAAHLGEVLWGLNQRDSALDIWRAGLRLKPDNPSLRATLQRLHIQLEP